MTTTPTLVPNRRLIVVLTAVVPLLCTVGAPAWVASFSGELPQQVALHWDVENRPDAFGSWQFSVGAASIGAVVLFGMAAAIGIGLVRAVAVRRIAVFLGMWACIAIPWFVAGDLYIAAGGRRYHGLAAGAAQRQYRGRHRNRR